MNKNIAGKKIKTLRLALTGSVSQRIFAEMLQLHGLDLTKNTIQQIESGKQVIKDYELRVIAKVLAVTTDELLN